MIELLLKSQMQSIRLRHVRMAFSDGIEEVGRFRAAKLLHLIGLIPRIVYARLASGATALYYPPAGPNRVPVYRDMAVLILTRWLFQRTVFHMQASGVSELYPRLNAVERWFFRRAYWRPDLVIRLTDATAPDDECFRARRVAFIPNATPDIAAEAKEQSPHEGPVRLLYVGAVSESKGVRVLLSACELLRQRGLDFSLRLVGECRPAAFETEARNAIAQANLEGHVTLCGVKTGGAKVDEFASADIFCFPSHFECESFGCVVVEAMASRLPVVATRWRSVPRIVDHRQTGLLCPIKDPVAFADAIEHLAEQPSLRRTMGDAGRRKYEALYTAERYQASMEAALAGVCDLQPPLHVQQGRVTAATHPSGAPV